LISAIQKSVGKVVGVVVFVPGTFRMWAELRRENVEGLQAVSDRYNDVSGLALDESLWPADNFPG